MPTSHRLVASLLILALGLAVLVACSKNTAGDASADAKAATSAASANSDAGETKKIAIVISTLNNPWFVVLADAAKKRVEELGYEAVVFDSENNTSKETAQFETIIAAGYAAILFNATDSDGSIANVRRAKEAGVPVFCIDREINATDAATSQILSDSYSGCVAIGEQFVEIVGEEGEYAELLGQSGDNNTHNRSRGFHTVVDRFPGLKMVAQQSGEFDRATAHAVMESILQDEPDIVAVFCGNDAMAMGAYQALVGAGKIDQVKVFGFDGADEVVKLIGEGRIEATGMQFPKTMARTAAEYADGWIKGHRDFDQKILVAVELVTRANVDEYGDFGRKDDP